MAKAKTKKTIRTKKDPAPLVDSRELARISENSKLKFVNTFGDSRTVFGITKDNDVYCWNAMLGLWVRNWDHDGTVRQALEAQEVARKLAEQEALKNATPANGEGNIPAQPRRAMKTVAGSAADALS